MRFLSRAAYWLSAALCIILGYGFSFGSVDDEETAYPEER